MLAWEAPMRVDHPSTQAATILFMHDDGYSVQTVLGAIDVAGGFQGYRPYWQADGWPDHCGVDRRFWTVWEREPDGPTIWPAVVDDFGVLRSCKAVRQIAQVRTRTAGVMASEAPSSDDIFSAADHYAQESREDGCRVFDRAGLIALCEDFYQRGADAAGEPAPRWCDYVSRERAKVLALGVPGPDGGQG